MKNNFTDIDTYIASFPIEVQEILEQMRATIRKAAPDATETISYAMPAFKLKNNLVYFAAYKNHIGFYPTSSGIKAFQQDIAGYKNSKGVIQFPINQPLPLDLISRIVTFRVNESLNKNGNKQLNNKKTKENVGFDGKIEL